MNNPAIGTSDTLRRRVTADMLADGHGNPGFFVLATPVLVELLESAAIQVLQPYLESGEASVGTKVAVQHTAPTPVDNWVIVTARVSDCSGRRVSFEIEASDDAGQIANGHHDRVIVEKTTFLAKLGERSQ